VCISWNIKCLIYLMQGVIMEFIIFTYLSGIQMFKYYFCILYTVVLFM